MASKSEYLKKYLSSNTGDNESGKKKKKRRKITKQSTNIIIHDDDVDWKTITPKTESTDDEDPEDAPIIAEMYEENGKRDARWKSLQDADEFPQIVKTEPMSPSNYDTSAGFYGRHDSPDISPPRKGRSRHDSPDISPPRKGRSRHDSPDISPPRKGRSRHDSPDISPPRKGRSRHDSPDISPPRKGRSRHDSPDISPPRKGRSRHDSPDISPPRKGRSGHDSRDISPPRKGPNRHNSSDISPPRKQRRIPDMHSSRSVSSDGKNQMLSGAKVGLQPAHGLKDEVRAAKEAKEKYYRNLDASLSGRNAETVYRDKEGKRVNPKMEKILTREEERKKLEEDERFAQWGRGVAQVKSAQEKAVDDLYEMSKPLARYRDDEDLEALLKERDRAGDPMLAFIKKKEKITGRDGRPKKERLMYKGNFPLNRYGIRPGYRWDGIDRSNGYEKTFFSKKASNVAIKEEAYKWSVEDM